MKILAAFVLAAASPLAAEVVHADNHGFEIRQSVLVRLPPDQALTAFTNVPDWWIADHTYSNNTANLSLDPRPGGCLCEKFPGGGGVEHMRVTYYEPGKYLIMTGAMGPLLYEAVNGIMNVSVEPEAGQTRLTIDYRASGFASGGAIKFAGIVDHMLGDTIQHYERYADAKHA